MPHSPDFQTLADYLTGTFDNRSQAMEDPVWYVGLQVWHQATNLFSDDSITIFAEQAKQLERLYTIFKDLKTEINFVPVLSSIHEGFIDDDIKVVCYKLRFFLLLKI